MRSLRPALTALMIGAAAPAFVAPAFAQTCACPPGEASAAGPTIEAEEPPPPLPVYEQPPIPAPGYVWTPGYWAWNTYDYYWVPGVWVQPAQTGLLWTPGYWAFVGGAYLFHAGYWGPHVGFYGGVNYGFGYNGFGYGGGRWEGSRFLYNTTVNNFGSVHITNVYTETVAVAPGAARVSFNGGPGGIALKPTPEQERLTTEERVRPTSLQVTQARTASMEGMQFRSANQGKPAVAATQRPGELRGPGVVPAKAAGSAELTPGPGPNALPTPNGELKTAPGTTPPAGAPSGERKAPTGATLTPTTPAAEPRPGELRPGERKLPTGATLTPAAPAGAPRPGELQRPNPVERPPTREERPLPGAATRGPAGVEKPVRPEAEPRREMEPQNPRESLQRPGPPKPAASDAERKLQHPERKERECGAPGQPPCR